MGGAAVLSLVIVPAAKADPTPQSVHARGTIIPLVDHHEHIFGPMQVDSPTTLLPAVKLPPDLARVLRERERISGTRNLGSLYAHGARALNIFFDTDYWVSGTSDIADLVEANGPRLRFVPGSYSVDGGTAFISGVVYADQEGEYDEHFMLALRRGRSGHWQIATEDITKKKINPFRTPLDAKTLIMRLDDAGIGRAVVLSTAYWLASPRRPHDPATEQQMVQSANDWMLQQTALYPTRLIPFCSVNPLASYAIAEMERCSRNPAVKGIKLHFANSMVDLRNPEHLAKVKEFFKATNSRHLALVLHFWPRGKLGPDYARIFIEQVLPEAPDIPVQIAHLGSGEGDMFFTVLGVFADAIARGDPRTRNLYFDVTEIVTEQVTEDEVKQITALVRRIGLNRIFFGSDTPLPQYRALPVQAWATFRRRMPLTDDEIRTIANNVAPYLR